MTFTILQSVYKNDNPQFLSECFNSIKESSLAPKKIVLIKDGILTDELESVISEWEKVLPLEIVGYDKNQGLAHALNYGLQFVDTDYVARMDSDDICCGDRFKKQVDFLDIHPEYAVCGTGIKEFYYGKANFYFEKERFYSEIVDKKSVSLYKGTPLGHPTIMIRTDILKQFLYSENTRMNEDIDLWFRLLKADYKFYNIQESLLKFRITDGTFKRRSMAKAFNEFRIYFSNLLSIFGFSLRLIYPFLRLVLRFMPYSFNKKIYFSNMRNQVLESKQ